MQTLGERLEEARKRKGLSVREAAEATKIRGDYLQKFEANSFDFDLPPLYVRGFLRTYARYLEFDPVRAVAEFDTMMADQGRAPRRETRENYGRVELGGEGAPESSAPRSGAGNGLDPVMLKYGLLGGAVLVILLVVWLLISVLSSRTEPRATPPRQTASDNTVAQPATQGAVNDLATSAQTLTFTASDVTRIKIVRDADKSVLFDGALGRGETRTFRKLGKLLVTVEKGANLRMEVNGRSYPVPLEGYGRFALD